MLKLAYIVSLRKPFNLLIISDKKLSTIDENRGKKFGY